MTSIQFFIHYGQLLHFNFNFNHYTQYGSVNVTHDTAQMLLVKAADAGRFLEHSAFPLIEKEHAEGKLSDKYYRMYIKYYRELVEQEDLVYKSIQHNTSILNAIKSLDTKPSVKK